MDKKLIRKLVILIIVAVVLLAGVGVLIVTCLNTANSKVIPASSEVTSNIEGGGVVKGGDLEIKRVLSGQEILNIGVQNDMFISTLSNSDTTDLSENQKPLWGINLSNDEHGATYYIGVLYYESNTKSRAMYDMVIWNVESDMYERNPDSNKSTEVSYGIEKAKRIYNSTDRYDYHRVEYDGRFVEFIRVDNIVYMLKVLNSNYQEEAEKLFLQIATGAI